MPKYSSIHIALPLMGERNYIPALIDSLNRQTYRNFILHVIVNQPDHYWEDDDKRWICENNQETIEYLSSLETDYDIDILDYSSKGRGWDAKNLGVGWARKTIMDHINQQGADGDLVVSLDGDTVFNPGYLQSLINNFNSNQKTTVLSVPYYHPIVDDDRANRAMLRYEIYMRNYSVNLWRIGSPYTFTALGSAMVFPLWSYRKIGGMTPKKSGEDFYFLQKMRKAGDMMVWNNEKVYPGTRFSDRVFFGTGPAMIKGDSGDWNSYPVYHYSLFDRIRRFYDSFEELYAGMVSSESARISEKVFGNADIWKTIIENSKDARQFAKAAHLKFDGLRILQFLKSSQDELSISDEECLVENLRQCFGYYLNKELNDILKGFSFNDKSIDDLNTIRNLLVQIEEDYQKNNLSAINMLHKV